MIILARPVAYGGNAARYAMEKEDATVVKVNHMPDYLDATCINRTGLLGESWNAS